MDVFTDMNQCARNVVSMFQTAKRSVYYSSFVCQMDIDLPGCPGITMNTLLTDAVNRGVQVHMFMNPSLQYGNEHPELRNTDPRVQFRMVTGDAYIPDPFKGVFGESYSNHHQKFLMADGQRIMIGGVGVHPCRAGWLVLNTEPDPYYWHEVGVEIMCTPEIEQWVGNMWNSVFSDPPFPLVAADTEHKIMIEMIRDAVSCIHLEAQLCISTPSTINQVLPTVAHRVARAYKRRQNDAFRFIMLVNTHQPDEHALISFATTVSLSWSIRELFECTRKLGIPDLFVNERVFIGTLENRSIHIKVHSNLIIQDGHTMIRSSSNLTDRSLSKYPCDNEVGVIVTGYKVALTQQALWKQYFMTPHEGPNMTPQEAFIAMRDETGVVRCIDSRVRSWIPDMVMREVHKLSFFGGRKRVNWVTLDE